MPPQSGFGQLRRLEQPLIAEIVNGQQSFRSGELRIAGQRIAQVNRQEAGLPVVAVENIGVKEMAGDFECGAGQNREPDVIIGVIAAGVAIKSVAALKQTVFHEIMGDGACAHLLFMVQTATPVRPIRAARPYCR